MHAFFALSNIAYAMSGDVDHAVSTLIPESWTPKGKVRLYQPGGDEGYTPLGNTWLAVYDL